MIQDHFVQGLIYDGRIRFVGANVTKIAQDLQKRHQLDPLTSIALGRAIGCVALLGADLKQEKSYVVLSIMGEGPLKKVVAECTGFGKIRGYTLPEQMASVLSKEDKVPANLGEAIGSGKIRVATCTNIEKQPHETICNLLNGEIAADLAHLFLTSSQIPSAVSAGVDLDKEGKIISAGAVLVQKVGGVELEDQVLSDIEGKLVRLNLSTQLSQGKSLAEIGEQIFSGKMDLGERTDLEFQCTCNNAKFQAVVASLPEDERKDIIEKEGHIEIRCHFCSSVYRYK